MNEHVPAQALVEEIRSVDVSIRGVNVSYGENHVLRDVDLDIRAGEFFAFLGPSGCGKTTLLRAIAGFNRPQSGEIRVGGVDIGGLPPWKRDIGMVFQSYALWPHMSVAANVAFGLEERRLPRAEITQRVGAALDLVGLGAFAKRMPPQLSGGQQQRVALARTIAIAPKVLLLDEPLSNLDAQMRVQVRREMRDLQKRLGLTTIFVTHDQEEANTICDRIAVMKDGVVQQVGAPMELYERPANLFVASFLGTANILPGVMRQEDGARVFDLGGGLRVAAPQAQDATHLVFRPQHASILAPGGGGLAACVRQVEFLGSTIRYEITLGEANVLVDAPFASSAGLHRAGEAVEVKLPETALLWLKD